MCQRRRARLWSCAFELAAVVLAIVSAGCETQTARVSLPQPANVDVQQVAVGIPTIKAYVGASDSNGLAAQGLTSADFRAIAAGKDLSITSVTSFRKSGEGIAYAILVDTSISVRVKKVFPQIQQAARAWAESMSDKDRMAIVPVGSRRQPPVFLGKSPDLVAAILSLQPVDDRTLLYDSIVRTLGAFDTTPGLPQRKAIVVITDGEDDDDVSGTTMSELSGRIANVRAPIFAIGVTSVPLTPNADRALKTLSEVAVSSGGAYLSLDGSSIGDVYESMHNKILDVYVGTLGCPRCPHDGSRHDFRISVRGTESEPMQIPLMGPGVPWMNNSLILYAVGGAYVILAAILLFVHKSRIERLAEEKLRTDHQREAEEAQRRLQEQAERDRELARKNAESLRRLEAQASAQIVVVPPPGPPPVASPRIQLYLVGKPGCNFIGSFDDRALIGKGEDCHLRISDDSIADHERQIQSRDGGFQLLDSRGSILAPLNHGAEFKVGASRVRFLIG